MFHQNNLIIPIILITLIIPKTPFIPIASITP